MEIFADTTTGHINIVTSGGDGKKGQDGSNGRKGPDSSAKVWRCKTVSNFLNVSIFVATKHY